MDLVLFAAVDDDLKFPPEIVSSLSTSEELRNIVIPMSHATRENLGEDDLWPGRSIFNTTKKTLEFWDQYWVQLATEPPPPVSIGWDEGFVDQTPARIQLALSPEFRNMVIPLSQANIDRIHASDLWDGRIIYNKTRRSLQKWSASHDAWLNILDETYVQAPPETISDYIYRGPGSDTWSFSSGIVPYDISGFIQQHKINKKVVVNYRFSRSSSIDRDTPSGAEFMLKLPTLGKASNATTIGPACIYRGSTRLHGRTIKLANENYIRIEYQGNDGKSHRLKDNAPFSTWNTDDTIYGQLIYEAL